MVHSEPGHNLNAVKVKNGQRKRGTFIPPSISQLIKAIKSGNLKVNGWI